MIGLIFGETEFPKYIYKRIKGKRKFLFFTFIKYRKDNVTAKNDIIAENDIQN